MTTRKFKRNNKKRTFRRKTRGGESTRNSRVPRISIMDEKAPYHPQVPQFVTDDDDTPRSNISDITPRRQSYIDELAPEYFRLPSFTETDTPRSDVGTPRTDITSRNNKLLSGYIGGGKRRKTRKSKKSKKRKGRKVGGSCSGDKCIMQVTALKKRAKDIENNAKELAEKKRDEIEKSDEEARKNGWPMIEMSPNMTYKMTYKREIEKHKGEIYDEVINLRI